MLAIPRTRKRITNTDSPATIQITTVFESPSNITPPPTKAIPSSQFNVGLATENWELLSPDSITREWSGFVSKLNFTIL